MTHSEHSGGCCSGHGAGHSTQETLDELDFTRGIWAAARDGEEDRVRELLTKGTHPSLKDAAGYTALHYASRAGHRAVVQLLLLSGASVDATTGGGATALHRAAHQGHRAVVETLLGAGADPALQDSDGCNAAHKAAGQARQEVLDLILQKHPECAGVSDKKGAVPESTATRRPEPEGLGWRYEDVN